MPRPARNMILFEAPTTIHFIWRCHNRDFLLKDNDIKQRYLDLLADNKQRYGIEIYGYAIMDNHFHAVLRLPGRTHWQNFSRTVNSQLAMSINKKYRRQGQVIMDRPRTIILESDNDVLGVLRYIELNPLRAGLVKRLRNYRWSSYQCHAKGKKDKVLDTCPALMSLGYCENTRRKAYQKFFEVRQIGRDLNRRREYVDAYFIGRLAWMNQRTESLQMMMRTKPPPE